MKTKLFITCLLLIIMCAPSKGATYLVGISPNHNTADRDAVFKAILRFVLEGVSTADEVLIYDALNRRLLTTFAIPDEKLFQQNPKARVLRLKTEIAALRTFLATENPHPAKMAGVIHTPEFLTLAGTQLRKTGQALNVILVGLPFYMSVEEPSFDQNAAVPSDGHLITVGASPFSTVEIKHALDGVTVHYAYLHDSFVNQFHAQRLQRFYCLFVQEAGGLLATWSPEIGLAFERARQNIRQSCLAVQLDNNDTKVEMRTVTPRTIPRWFPPTNAVASATAGVTSYVAPNALPSGTLGIGVMWSEDCDFDLWVSPAPGAKDLSFANPLSEYGKYFKDYRNRNDQLDYEFTELKSPVDLRRVKAFVNLYDGTTTSPTGIVVVHYQGRTYQSTFQLKATSGNRAQDLANRSGSPHWVELDLLKIISATP